MEWDKLLSDLLEKTANEALKFALEKLKEYFTNADLIPGEDLLAPIATIILEVINHKGKLSMDDRAAIQERIAAIEIGFKPEEMGDA